MKKRPNILSATFVKTVNIPGRYGDGRGGLGLTLLVKPTARNTFSKSWAQSVRIDGRRTTLGLGRYPVVTLAMARKRALANARAIALGRDPRRSSDVIPTFASACETVIAIHAESWSSRGRSESQWRASLRDYAMQRLGAKPVDEIDTADVMAVLLPIWSTKRETARRVRHRIGAVMKWAVAQGYRNDNPAGDAIAAALPKGGVKRQHLPALHYSKVAAAMDRVRRSKARLSTVLAFEFLVLTACRSGEVRSARWEEVDSASGVWRIPAERMKAGREHRVPLSAQALAVLDEARTLSAQECWLGVPFAFRSDNEPVGNADAVARPQDRCGATWIPLQLSRLGSRMHRGSEGDLRVGACSRKQRSCRSGLPPQRFVREAACSDGRLGRLPH